MKGSEPKSEWFQIGFPAPNEPAYRCKWVPVNRYSSYLDCKKANADKYGKGDRIWKSFRIVGSVLNTSAGIWAVYGEEILSKTCQTINEAQALILDKFKKEISNVEEN